MKFKVDENLPVEIAELLVEGGYDAKTVNHQQLKGIADPLLADVCNREGRVLVTLDLDFADIWTYPPQKYPGFIVMRVGRQDKKHILKVFKKIVPAISLETLKHHLWIVEEERIRIHGDK